MLKVPAAMRTMRTTASLISLAAAAIDQPQHRLEYLVDHVQWVVPPLPPLPLALIYLVFYGAPLIYVFDIADVVGRLVNSLARVRIA